MDFALRNKRFREISKFRAAQNSAHDIWIKKREKKNEAVLALPCHAMPAFFSAFFSQIQFIKSVQFAILSFCFSSV